MLVEIMRARYDQYLKSHGLAAEKMEKYIDKEAMNLFEEIIFSKYIKFEQNELSIINNAFNEQNINYVIMKGLPLYNDIYESGNRHFSSDIDILVSQSDLLQAVKALERIGYFYNGAVITDEVLARDWHLLMGMQHIEPLVKQIENHPIIKKSVVELHHAVAPTYRSDFGNECEKNLIDTQAMISRRIRRNCINCSVYRLNPTDEFVMLILHYCAHLFISCRRAIRSNSEIDMNTNLLIDMAGYWTKYSSAIDMKFVYSELIKKCRGAWLFLIAHILEDIFEIHILADINIDGINDQEILGQDTFRRIVLDMAQNSTYELLSDCRRVIKCEIRKAMMPKLIMRDSDGIWHANLKVLKGSKYNQELIYELPQNVYMYAHNSIIVVQVDVKMLNGILECLKQYSEQETMAEDIGEPGLFISVNCCLDSSRNIEQTYNAYIRDGVPLVSILRNGRFEKCAEEQAILQQKQDKLMIQIKDILSITERGCVVINIYVSRNAPYYHMCVPLNCEEYVI